MVVPSRGQNPNKQKKAPVIPGLLAGSSWLLHIKQMYIKKSGWMKPELYQLFVEMDCVING
jgi:hypothetical protein